MGREILQFIEPEHEYVCVEMHDIPGDMIRWLQDTMPDEHRWFINKNEIVFYHKSDHIMFLLRWS
jgi:hypothetical protein